MKSFYTKETKKFVMCPAEGCAGLSHRHAPQPRFILQSMRLIGHLANESSVRLFVDCLLVQGIRSELEHDAKEGWAIWISDEDKVEQAAELLKAFRANPDDPKYRAVARNAADVREREKKDLEAHERRVRNRRHLFRPLTGYGFGPLTFALIVASIVVFLRSGFGQSIEPIRALFITDFGGSVVDRTLPEIRSGEIWRLFTPIFIHFGPWHIIFNMLWVRDLGSMIEARQNSLQLLLLVAVIAACSNLAQFYWGGPVFGGMSGVVYGLLGYVWIRGKFDPGSGLGLHSSTVTMMIIWFFACLVGIIPHVANMAHGAGLGLGMAWGFLSSWRYRRKS